MKNIIQTDENHMSTAITLFITYTDMDTSLKAKIPKIKKEKAICLDLKVILL
ncbi:MAG: hypothetical protein RR835_11075 [Peptostreptococcaceae bacterium]